MDVALALFSSSGGVSACVRGGAPVMHTRSTTPPPLLQSSQQQHTTHRGHVAAFQRRVQTGKIPQVRGSAKRQSYPHRSPRSPTPARLHPLRCSPKSPGPVGTCFSRGTRSHRCSWGVRVAQARRVKSVPGFLVECAPETSRSSGFAACVCIDSSRGLRQQDGALGREGKASCGESCQEGWARVTSRVGTAHGSPSAARQYVPGCSMIRVPLRACTKGLRWAHLPRAKRDNPSEAEECI